jgi:hypothetical protein
MPSRADRALDVRQSPIGFYNMGLSYLDAADHLTNRQLDATDGFHLPFEGPIRHLYSHSWELFLKACLFEQGELPSDLKYEPGHRLVNAWDQVDKDRFAVFKLSPRTRDFLARLDAYHPTKFYAYPITGFRQDFSLTYIRAASQRFRLTRKRAGQLFGSFIHDRGSSQGVAGSADE